MTLAYVGEWLRTILSNLFVEHTLNIPMFDFSIGLGHDIVSTLHYYGLGDPLNALAVFFPPEYTEHLYGFLLVIRLYLAGLFFSLYMNTRVQNPQAVFVGALSYAFTPFALTAVINHPMFAIGLMYFPLVIWGIDRTLEKKSPVLYIVSLALAVLSNFYFAYMICIFMVIYAAIKYLSEYRKEGARRFFTVIGQFALYTCSAMLIPMFIFLPQIENTLSLDRLNVTYEVPLFYGKSYYSHLPMILTDGSASDKYAIMGFGGVAVLALIISFLKIKKRKTIPLFFTVCGIFLLFPFFGHMMNGFGYVTNRWTWVIAMPVCVSLVYAYDDFWTLTVRDKKKLFWIIAAYAALVFIVTRSHSYMSMLMIAMMFAALLLIVSAENGIFRKKTISRALSAMVVLSLCVQAFQMYSFTGSDKAKNFLRFGEVYKYMVSDTAGNSIKSLDDDDEFFRYDNYIHMTCNDAMLSDTHSTTFFLSLSNPYISRFMTEMAYNIFFEQQYENCDRRYALQILTGSKYMCSAPDANKMIYYSPVEQPSEYTNQITLNSSGDDIQWIRGTDAQTISNPDFYYATRRNNYYLPMGYTYDSVISRELWDSMTPAARQNAVLQGAATDAALPLPQTQIDTSGYEEMDLLPLLKSTEGIEVEGNTIRVKDTEAVLTVSLPTRANAEVYVYCEDVSLNGGSTYQNVEEQIDKYEQIEDSPYGDFDRRALRVLDYNEKYETLPARANISFTSDATGSGDTIHYFGPTADFYSGFDSYLVNVGFLPSPDIAELLPEQTITIKFSAIGEYTFSKMNFIMQDISNMPNLSEARQQDVLENTVMDDDYVSGTITLDAPKLLATQIPYSEGWRVWVDGEEAELLDVNTMFCGVMLDAGDHTVEFRYATPHWQLAVAMSAAGLVMLLVIALLWHKKHPKAAPAGIDGQPVAKPAAEVSAVSDAAATAAESGADVFDVLTDTTSMPDKTASEEQTEDEA